MSNVPSKVVLPWAAGAIGADAWVVTVEARHAGVGPWGLRIARGSEISEVVLRVSVAGWIGNALIATGAAALRVAAVPGLAERRGTLLALTLA